MEEVSFSNDKGDLYVDFAVGDEFLVEMFVVAGRLVTDVDDDVGVVGASVVLVGVDDDVVEYVVGDEVDDVGTVVAVVGVSVVLNSVDDDVVAVVAAVVVGDVVDDVDAVVTSVVLGGKVVELFKFPIVQRSKILKSKSKTLLKFRYGV